MVTLDPPELVRVSDKVELLLTCTLPNESELGFAPRTPAVAPVPLSGMFRVGFDPLLVMATLPPTLPAEVGANVTLKLVL